MTTEIKQEKETLKSHINKLNEVIKEKNEKINILEEQLRICYSFLRKTTYYESAKREAEAISIKNTEPLLPPVLVTYQNFIPEYQRIGLPVWLLQDSFYSLPSLPTLPKKCDILPQLLSISVDLLIDRMLDDIQVEELNTVDGGIYERSSQYIQTDISKSIK